MCIRRETREKARPSLAFSRISKPHTHIIHMFRQCTSIVYLLTSKTYIADISYKNYLFLYLFKKCDKIHNFYPLCSNFIKINTLIKM